MLVCSERAHGLQALVDAEAAAATADGQAKALKLKTDAELYAKQKQAEAALYAQQKEAEVSIYPIYRNPKNPWHLI